MIDVKLSDCKLITSTEYCELENPEFVGQTKVDSEGMYYMVWKCGDIFYKTHNEL